MKKIIALLMSAVMALSMFTACGSADTAQQAAEPLIAAEEPAGASLPEPEIPDTYLAKAVFRGVNNYGYTLAAMVQRQNAAVYLFEINGEIQMFPIIYTRGFEIQNLLMEDYTYMISVRDGTVTDVELLDELPEYDPVVQAEPGLRTVKNFLKTCFEPMGTALYVYGGNWNWQDDGSAVQSTHIGVPGTWVDFYKSQNVNYEYANDNHPDESYYPYGGWNEFYYAGTDCSGYAGWAVYNTLNTEDGQEGYVMGARRQARVLAEEYGYGTWTDEPFDTEEDPLRPGDMVSTPGHIWICVGRCEDGSSVIIHSTVTQSATGRDGGGVQLSAINPNHDSKMCRAYELACEYTEKYFPEWAQRYPVVMKKYADYVDFSREYENPGRFRWNSLEDNGLDDPEGYRDMSAEEVLKDIFGE